MRYSLVILLSLSAAVVAGSDIPSGYIYADVQGLDRGHPVWSRTELPFMAFHYDPSVGPGVQPVSPPRAHRVIAPEVQEMLNRGDGAALELLVTFKDATAIQPFPQINRELPPDDPQNAAVAEQRQGLVMHLKQARSGVYQRRAHEFGGSSIQVLETFWLFDAMRLLVPPGAVASLAARPDVVSVELAHTVAPPPNVSAGRALINSDPWYYNASGVPGYFQPRIANIDTGYPASHVQFTPTSHLLNGKDCFHSTDTDCVVTTFGWDLYDRCNHSTSTNAVLTALGSQGDVYRGVTAFMVGNYRVADNNCQNDAAATTRAIQAAASDGYQIMLAEVQFQGDDLSNISIAADAAYDAGVSIIATNGNFGPGAGTVRSPANARKVIGVGAYDYQSLLTPSYQSLGPTRDNRIKPDIQTPTNTQTASATGYTDLRFFGGTSGAGPYAAGAAALYSWYLNPDNYLNHYSLPPGQIYAAMIDGGNQASFNNTEGAGKLRMPLAAGNQWWGAVTLSYGQYVDIPIQPQNWSGSKMSVAIWWPESRTQQHNQVWLSVFDPIEWRGYSHDPYSVFQKVIVAGAYGGARVGDIWDLRIGGAGTTQTVYWSAHVLP